MERLLATTFLRPIGNGATSPLLVVAEDATGNAKEVVLKYENPHLPLAGLMREVVAAGLAQQLALPVPAPYLIELDDQFIQSIAGIQPSLAAVLRTGSKVGFGSQRLPAGYATWPSGAPVPASAMRTAAEILAFDVMLRNDDRKGSNPNLHWNGTEFAIFDHEKAMFPPLFPWLPAVWEPGAAVQFVVQHVLGPPLKSTVPSYARFIAAWSTVTSAKLAQIAAEVPAEWAKTSTERALVTQLIDDVGAHVTECISEILGALK